MRNSISTIIFPVLLVFTSVSNANAQVNSNKPNWFKQGLQAEYSDDFSLAVENYTKSSALGVTDAGYALGRVYRNMGDTASSLEWFLQSANSGNKFSQYEVGMIFLRGNTSAAVNTQYAYKWLKYAAKAGHSEASYELYLLSDDLQWLEFAAEQGIEAAIRDIAVIYAKGSHSVKQDAQKSENWLEKLAKIKEDRIEK